MKHILLNLKSFFRNEKMLFFIMVICILSSSFVMNFSFGLYVNYNTALNEANKELKIIMPIVSESEKVTKAEFQTFVESLDEKTQNQIEIFYASSDLTEFGYDDHYSFFPMRFDINNGKYCTPETVKEIWENTKLIKSGGYISSEDEETGALSAIVSQDICDKGVGDTIEFLGQKYNVVGTYEAGSFTPLVPFLTVPGDVGIVSCSFTFSEVVTRSAYNDLVDTAKEILPDKLVFPELELPDDDVLSMYRNIILISVIIAAVSVMNFAMLYLFIIRKRRNTLAVMRLCGARKIQVAAIYLFECVFITVPSFLLGTLLFDIMLNTVFLNIFPYMKEAYSIWVYAMIFAVYLVVMLLILSVIVIRNTSANVKECLLEGKI